MPLHVWSSAGYSVPLPEGHRFPMAKYALLRERVLAAGLVPAARVHEPERATGDELRLVHTADYVARFDAGAMTPPELRRLGFPWSAALVERSHRSVGGTIAAARAALEHGVAMNLAGGTHHAFPAHGEGFCVYNDVAVAIRVLQRERRIGRAAIVDLDVHQGNGTHAIFTGDASVYTFSMHGGRNYPFRAPPPGWRPGAAAPDERSWGLRVPGSLDIALDDGAGDDEYLSLLADALPRVLRDSQPDLVVYLAGADPHEGDRLGKLRLTFAGLARRDAMVLESCREVGLPVAVVIAGGYGRSMEDTLRVHAETVRIACGA